MLSVDFHCHSTFSFCGLHTLLELFTEARRLGMKGLAITDHGPKCGGRVPTPFWDRYENMIPEVQLFRGMECNLLSLDGEIDFPVRYLEYADLVAVGIHHNLPDHHGQEAYTDALIRALDRYPYIDIITHPNMPSHRVDFRRLAREARERGIALELNNSKNRYHLTTPELTASLVEACAIEHCRISVSSDTHALNELGRDDAVRPFLTQAEFPKDRIVNDTLESAIHFINERRQHKKTTF